MTNINSLKKSIEGLKAKRKTINKKSGFNILQSYMDGELSYDEAMKLVNDENYIWGDVVKLILESGHYDDETKRKMEVKI